MDRVTRRLHEHTLCSLSKPHLFSKNYPELAAIARELARTIPGIGEFRFKNAHIAGMKGIDGPVEASVTLESATRWLVINLLPNAEGRWVATIEADRELEQWERKH